LPRALTSPGRDKTDNSRMDAESAKRELGK
jgi:hypothetical protein